MPGQRPRVDPPELAQLPVREVGQPGGAAVREHLRYQFGVKRRKVVGTGGPESQ